MPMSNSEARKRAAEKQDLVAANVEPALDLELLAAVFRTGWHLADEAGQTGTRVESGLRAVFSYMGIKS